MPNMELVVGTLDESHEGGTTVLAISFSMIGSPSAIESLRGTCGQVHNLQGSGIILEKWIAQG